MNCEKCGINLNKNGLKQHENKCNLNKDDIKIILDEYLNNGLSTKDIKEKYKLSDPIVYRIIGDKIRSVGESISLSFKNKKRIISEETKEKISISRKKYLEENKNKIKWPGNDSHASLKFKDILKENSIFFVEEFSPLEDRFFKIDIAFPDKKIGIEINGEQHYERNGNLKEYYQNRHDLIEKEGWKLYEISHYLVYKKEFLESIIDELKNNNLDNIDYSFYIKEKINRNWECGNKKAWNAKKCWTCYSIKNKINKNTNICVCGNKKQYRSKICISCRNN